MLQLLNEQILRVHRFHLSTRSRRRATHRAKSQLSYRDYDAAEEARQALIGRTGELGTLAPGAATDVSLFRVVSGEFHFRDSAGVEEIGGARLEPVAVIRNGRRYDCTLTP